MFWSYVKSIALIEYFLNGLSGFPGAKGNVSSSLSIRYALFVIDVEIMTLVNCVRKKKATQIIRNKKKKISSFRSGHYQVNRSGNKTKTKKKKIGDLPKNKKTQNQILHRKSHQRISPVTYSRPLGPRDITAIVDENRSGDRVQVLNEAVCKKILKMVLDSPGDLGSILGYIIPKTLKLALDISFLNTQ